MADGYLDHGAWRPPGTRRLAGCLGHVDRLFDRVYSSRYNPLYRTGTLAALLLAVALVTGVYLIFVYDIARPYQSMVAIQNDVLLGRWIRALHRYASDAAVVAVALHVMRLAVQGKTWGPRVLAWITGVLLAGMMFLSAFTGFVLVWDVFGQKLAVGGAKMLRLLPIFVEPPDRAFVGGAPVPPQFFFMNLFLHVAIPLGMVAFLWLHTSKLARAAWFPEKKVVWGTLAAFVGVSVLWPAPLPRAADLLAIPGRVETDWFYGFWIPLAELSPDAALAAIVVAGGLLVAIPWVLRPRRAERPAPAVADPDKCEGCQQCFTDCPYEAIEMVPGKNPDRHPLRANVLADACVSCGLCAASCASLAIGPEGRTAWHQLAAARDLVKHAPEPRTVLVIACRNNGGVASRVRAAYADDGSIEWMEVDCAGTLHPGTVSYLANHFDGVLISSCPPQNCLHREGATLTDARMLHDQRPAIPGRLGRQLVRVVHHSTGEWRTLVAAVTTFTSEATASGGEGPAVAAARDDSKPVVDTARDPRQSAAGDDGEPATSLTRAAISGREAQPPSGGGEAGYAVVRTLAAVFFTALLLGGVALGSRASQGVDADHAVLRLGWRLAGEVRETCRDLTPDELAKRAAHMRTPRECRTEVLAYDLEAIVDGQIVVKKTIWSPGLRADRPLMVEEDVPVAPGDHHVKVTFAPEDRRSDGRIFVLERRMRFAEQRVVLVALEADALVTKSH